MMIANTRLPARSRSNAKIPAATLLAALSDCDAGMSLIDAERKHGVSYQYLGTLKHKRARRPDVQAARLKCSPLSTGKRS